ncbi:MAG: hypothetical protein DRO14_01975 [Thermoprotei archaeon]|nr:MAG: hypothetical protein DRO14_01975 [Thermoprotei archaeon]
MTTVVVAAKYVIIPRKDVILPPLTSKVMKYIIESSNSRLASLLSARKFLKPSSMSVLFLGNKPLYSESYSSEDRVLNARCGDALICKLAVATSDNVSIECFKEIEGSWSTPYGYFKVALSELEIVPLKYLSIGLSKIFKILFITPTVLTAKHMVPPPLKDKSKSLPERHRLLPQPSFIFSYLLKLWNSIAGPEERIPGPGAGDWEAYKLGRLADVTLVEVDYRLRPVTVVIGRDSRGRLRRARGFTGWVIYECLSRKLLSIYDRLLALATYLGVGRSRGIGLGMIKVTNLKLGGSESSQKKP